MRIVIDIHSRKPWPASQLSNFAEAPFTLDGLRFTCMEGFLQSLKDPMNQEEYQYLDAKAAKARGSQIRCQNFGHLYWEGNAFPRNDWCTYKRLLFRAYDAMFAENPKSVDALLGTGHSILWHSVGKPFRCQTCLTTFEFLYILYRKRRSLRRKIEK